VNVTGDPGPTPIDLGTFPGRGKKAVKSVLGVGGPGSDVLYQFTITQPARLKSSVKAKGDLAFELRDTAGNVILASDRPKRKPEALRKALAAGTYVLHVTLKDVPTAKYVLKTAFGRPSKKELAALGGT
jgi:hypothetical protein